MKVVAVVQSRYGSSRLPGKALRPIAGKPMLAHVLDRARAIRGVDVVVLATTFDFKDNALTWIADDRGIPVFRGDEADVLGRFVAACAPFAPDAVMRITGDCPLLAPDVCERVLADYRDLQEPPVDFVSNDTTSSGYPDGTDCEVFAYKALLQAHADVSRHAAADREHVTTWLRRNCVQRVVRPWEHFAASTPWPKLSVDSEHDLELVRRIYGHLPDGDFSFAATASAVLAAVQED